MKTKLSKPRLAHRLGITPQQELALEICKSYITNYPKETMWAWNADHIRYIHDEHFPDTECMACVMLICQYYSQLMGGISVNAYFELLDQTTGILNTIKNDFKDYEGKSIK